MVRKERFGLPEYLLRTCPSSLREGRRLKTKFRLGCHDLRSSRCRMQRVHNAQCPCCESRESETIQMGGRLANKRRSSRPGGGRCREFSCYAWEGLHAIAGVSLLWSLGSRGGGLQLINQLKIEDGGHTVVHIAAPGAFRPAPPGFPRDTPAIALSPSHACGPCHEEFSAPSQLRTWPNHDD